MKMKRWLSIKEFNSIFLKTNFCLWFCLKIITLLYLAGLVYFAAYLGPSNIRWDPTFSNSNTVINIFPGPQFLFMIIGIILGLIILIKIFNYFLEYLNYEK